MHTSANEAYADGAGVCQDFAHLALALAKSVGLPSRYVSGYFHPGAGRHHRRGDHRGEPRLGGGVDRARGGATTRPTTARWGSATSPSGAGRDYADVPPVKGIYAGNAENTMRVVVRMTRTH